MIQDGTTSTLEIRNTDTSVSLNQKLGKIDFTTFDNTVECSRSNRISSNKIWTTDHPTA